jgi:SAM-dependent methyltransferase
MNKAREPIRPRRSEARSPRRRKSALPASCPLCGGSRLRPLFIVGNRPYVQCLACRSLVVALPQKNPPRPANYRDVLVSSRLNADRERRLHLARGRLIDACLSGGLSGRHVLDVDTGLGGFVEALTTYFGARGAGLEVDGVRVKLALEDRRPVFQANFYKDRLPESSFDVLTFLGNLDRYVNPVEVLKKAQKMVKPGGYVVIMMPNAAALEVLANGRRWRGYREFGEARFFATPAGVRRMLAAAGLEVHRLVTCTQRQCEHPLPWKLSRVLAGPAVTDRGRVRRLAVLREMLLDLAARAGLGSYLLAVGRSPEQALAPRDPSDAPATTAS